MSSRAALELLASGSNPAAGIHSAAPSHAEEPGERAAPLPPSMHQQAASPLGTWTAVRTAALAAQAAATMAAAGTANASGDLPKSGSGALDPSAELEPQASPRLRQPTAAGAARKGVSVLDVVQSTAGNLRWWRFVHGVARVRVLDSAAVAARAYTCSRQST